MYNFRSRLHLRSYKYENPIYYFMKKLILSIFLLVALSFTANAQRMSKNALGLRFGSDQENNGFEFSYQRKLSKANRFEADLGWASHGSDHYNDQYNSFKLTGLYEWVWKIDGGFNWYLGAGAGIWNYSYNYDYYKGHYYSQNNVFATLDGDIGIEYNFDFPLQIALDLRPAIYFGDTYHDDDFRSNLALALRYRFN